MTIDFEDEPAVVAPVVYANRFVVQVGAQIVRLSMSDERIKGGRRFPVANAVMDRANAEQLRDLLISLLPK